MRKFFWAVFLLFLLFGGNILAVSHRITGQGTAVDVTKNTTSGNKAVSLKVFPLRDPQTFFILKNILPRFSGIINFPNIFIPSLYGMSEDSDLTAAMVNTYYTFIVSTQGKYIPASRSIEMTAQVHKNAACITAQCQFTCFDINDRSSNFLRGRKKIFEVKSDADIFSISDTVSGILPNKNYSCYASCICGNDAAPGWISGDVINFNTDQAKEPYYICSSQENKCVPAGLHIDADECFNGLFPKIVQGIFRGRCFTASENSSGLCYRSCYIPPKPPVPELKKFYACRIQVGKCEFFGEFLNMETCAKQTVDPAYFGKFLPKCYSDSEGDIANCQKECKLPKTKYVACDIKNEKCVNPFGEFENIISCAAQTEQYPDYLKKCYPSSAQGIAQCSQECKNPPPPVDPPPPPPPPPVEKNKYYFCLKGQNTVSCEPTYQLYEAKSDCEADLKKNFASTTTQQCYETENDCATECIPPKESCAKIALSLPCPEKNVSEQPSNKTYDIALVIDQSFLSDATYGGEKLVYEPLKEFVKMRAQTNPNDYISVIDADDEKGTLRISLTSIKNLVAINQAIDKCDHGSDVYQANGIIAANKEFAARGRNGVPKIIVLATQPFVGGINGSRNVTQMLNEISKGSAIYTLQKVLQKDSSCYFSCSTSLQASCNKLLASLQPCVAVYSSQGDYQNNNKIVTEGFAKISQLINGSGEKKETPGTCRNSVFSGILPEGASFMDSNGKNYAGSVKFSVGDFAGSKSWSGNFKTAKNISEIFKSFTLKYTGQDNQDHTLPFKSEWIKENVASDCIVPPQSEDGCSMAYLTLRCPDKYCSSVTLNGKLFGTDWIDSIGEKQNGDPINIKLKDILWSSEKNSGGRSITLLVTKNKVSREMFKDLVFGYTDETGKRHTSSLSSLDENIFNLRSSDNLCTWYACVPRFGNCTTAIVPWDHSDIAGKITVEARKECEKIEPGPCRTTYESCMDVCKKK